MYIRKKSKPCNQYIFIVFCKLHSYNQVPNGISTQQTFFLVIFCLLQGSGLHSSEVVQGMVFKREVEGDINALQNAKIVAFSCPLDAMTTETKVG